jgi:hypothetical protein
VLLTANAQVAATVDDPMKVALTAVELLRAKVVAGERSSLTLTVAARDNSRFLVHLKAVATAELGAHHKSLHGYCELSLTNAMKFADAVGFIAALLAAWPDALASASLSLVAEDFQWRGAPEGSRGSLRLIDWKALARGTPKQRSSLLATLTFRGESLQDVAFVSCLKAVSDETDIAFDAGSRSSSREDHEISPPSQRLAIEVAFQEALSRTGADIRRLGVEWRGHPGLMTYQEAVDFRFEHWGDGSKVSFPGPIKRLMKSDFPEFTLKKGRGLWFLKPITEELALHLVFDNDRLGSIGKGFTINVGLEGISGALENMVWRESLFQIFRADRLEPCWTYSTQDDLATAASGLIPLLRAVLTTLESHCRLLLEPLPSLETLSRDIVRRGSITAREGWREAIAEARDWSSKAQLFRLASGGEPQWSTMLGPGLGPDGRLRSHSHWSYLFRSSERSSETLIVQVPSVGAVRSSLSVKHPATDPPIGDDWIDTDQLLAICGEIWREASEAESLERAVFLRCELRAGGPATGIEQRGSPLPTITPEPPPSDRWWTVEYRTVDRGRVRTSEARLDARSGGHVRVVTEVY